MLSRLLLRGYVATQFQISICYAQGEALCVCAASPRVHGGIGGGGNCAGEDGGVVAELLVLVDDCVAVVHRGAGASWRHGGMATRRHGGGAYARHMRSLCGVAA